MFDNLPAHGIGSRQDLPLPFGLVLLGAALVLIVSFWVLAKAWPEPRFSMARGPLGGRPLPWLTRVVDQPVVSWGARCVVLALVGWVGLALVTGQDRLTNPVFGVVFVWLWVGLVPVALLFGGLWGRLHPVRWLGPRHGIAGAGVLSRAGVYPAAAGVVAFAWLELVQPDRTTLPVLRGWVLAWVVLVVGGTALWGRRWVAAADPFDAYADAVGRLSPLRRSDGVLRLVNPFVGLLRWQPPPGTAALACTLLGATAFDSFGNTSWWVRHVQSSDAPRWLWGSIGLAAMIAVVGGTYAAASRLMRGGLRRGVPGGGTIADAMAPSLVPIVVGYALGHYLSLLVIEGQRTAIQLSDPLGRGWNVFGTAELGVNAVIFDYPMVTALIQLVSIVGGHVVGVVAAHDKAVALLRPDQAIRRQLPLLAVMVFYTLSGLVLLFSP